MYLYFVKIKSHLNCVHNILSKQILKSIFHVKVKVYRNYYKTHRRACKIIIKSWTEHVNTQSCQYNVSTACVFLIQHSWNIFLFFFFIHICIFTKFLIVLYVSRACAVFVIEDDVITYIYTYGRTQWHKNRLHFQYSAHNTSGSFVWCTRT